MDAPVFRYDSCVFGAGPAWEGPCKDLTSVGVAAFVPLIGPDGAAKGRGFFGEGGPSTPTPALLEEAAALLDSGNRGTLVENGSSHGP